MIQPKDEEMVSLLHVVLTSAEDWDPYLKAFTKKEEIAQRCSVVAKERSNRMQLEEQIAQDKRDKKINSMDFNLSSQMEVHLQQVSSFTCYDQYVTADMHDLSGENLYSSLVKLIHVASDDSEGNGLEGGEDEDFYQSRNILQM
jgi:hypothetical protein